MQIEEILELEQRVADLKRQNGQLREENGALRKLMEDQSHTHTQHLRAYQGELVQQLQAGLKAQESASGQDHAHLIAGIRQLEDQVCQGIIGDWGKGKRREGEGRGGGRMGERGGGRMGERGGGRMGERGGRRGGTGLNEISASFPPKQSVLLLNETHFFAMCQPLLSLPQVLALRREHQECEEIHHDELKAAVDKVEEHQQKYDSFFIQYSKSRNHKRSKLTSIAKTFIPKSYVHKQ